MTRTTTTTTAAAAAAAAAKPVRRPRAGKVRTVKVDPATLATATPAELAAPILPEAIAPAQEPAQEPVKAIPAKFAAAAAKVAAAKAAKPARRQATPRVNVTAHEAASLAAMGWAVPKVDANWEADPKKRQRFNTCKGGEAYDILAETISENAVTLAEIAEFWLATMGAPEEGKKVAPQAIIQQVSNRLQRKVTQDGIIIRAF